GCGGPRSAREVGDVGRADAGEIGEDVVGVVAAAARLDDRLALRHLPEDPGRPVDPAERRRVRRGPAVAEQVVVGIGRVVEGAGPRDAEGDQHVAGRCRHLALSDEIEIDLVNAPRGDPLDECGHDTTQSPSPRSEIESSVYSPATISAGMMFCGWAWIVRVEPPGSDATSGNRGRLDAKSVR